jgi:hypothetical protein
VIALGALAMLLPRLERAHRPALDDECHPMNALLVFMDIQTPQRPSAPEQISRPVRCCESECRALNKSGGTSCARAPTPTLTP